jgi:hypothetical protein
MEKKNLATIDTRKDAVAIMEKQSEKKVENSTLSETDKIKAFISAAENSDAFKAAKKSADAELRKLQATLYAKVYAPYCANYLSEYFAGADADEIKAEISQFNNDTANCTILIASESPEKFGENSCTTFATENRNFYGYVFSPESAAKAARLVNYWLEYRRNIVDSLAAKVAAKKATARKAAKAEKSAVELLAEKYGVSVEQLNSILAANLAK